MGEVPMVTRCLRLDRSDGAFNCIDALRPRGIWPTWHSALRLSPVSAYGRFLRLDAAALSATPTRSFKPEGVQPSLLNALY